MSDKLVTDIGTKVKVLGLGLSPTLISNGPASNSTGAISCIGVDKDGRLYNVDVQGRAARTSWQRLHLR